MRTRVIATLSFIFCIISLIINFLCLFAGNESSYMWNSPIVSVRTRQVEHPPALWQSSFVLTGDLRSTRLFWDTIFFRSILHMQIELELSERFLIRATVPI